jgi:hypothetical protein
VKLIIISAAMAENTVVGGKKYISFYNVGFSSSPVLFTTEITMFTFVVLKETEDNEADNTTLLTFTRDITFIKFSFQIVRLVLFNLFKFIFFFYFTINFFFSLCSLISEFFEINRRPKNKENDSKNR